MDALAYLRLLAADADLAAFDEPVRRARATGADAGAVEQARRVGSRGDLVSDVLEPARHDGARGAARDSPSLAGEALGAAGDVLERARQLGLDLGAPHVVVVAASEVADRRRLGLPAGQLADRYGGLAGEHEGRQVLLLPDSDPQPVAEQVSAELSAALRAPVTAGAAPADGAACATRWPPTARPA